jgi:hypothetical protein
MSWLQLGGPDADFGVRIPNHVDIVMPRRDGCVQLMEAESRVWALVIDTRT